MRYRPQPPHERILASEGLSSKDLGLQRLQPILGNGAAVLFELVISVYGEDVIEHVHRGRDDLRLYCAAVERVLREPDDLD